jgi:UDP-N-acetylglucosamine:LPS N-acetylglucosamine transferase
VKARILAVAPGGGHLREARIALELIRESEVVYVTPPNMSFIVDPHRSLHKYLLNILQSIAIYRKTRPEIILSNGGGQCIALFLMGKLLGCKTIFVESGSRIHFPSRTGKLLYHFSDHFFIQSVNLFAFYPKAQLLRIF